MKPGTLKQMNWLDLPPDVMLHIFLKLGVIEILLNAQSLCSSWRKLAREPQLYRRFDLSDPWSHFRPNSFTRARRLIEVVGNCLISALCILTVMRALRLICCYRFKEDILIEALKKFPLLEEFELCHCSFSKNVIEAAGISCPKLKFFRLNPDKSRAFRLNQSAFVDEFNEEALAIAATMPGLRRLHLFGNMMNDNGLKAILEKCPHLEYLDLRECFNITINKDFSKKFGGIKEIRLTNDSTDEYEFKLDIYYSE
ncbi:hypothetical protein ACHQM5_003667 [Ranunculus cassubicifolius]